MVSFFKDRSTASVIWVLLLSLAVHSHFFIAPPTVIIGKSNGLVSVLFERFLAGPHPVLVIFLYHLLVVSQALRLNYIFSDQRMYNKPNFLTAMAYILVTALFKEWNNLTPSLVACSFVIWFYAKTIKLYNNPNPKTLIFNLGLIIGMSVLLYHPTALLILVAVFALFVVRPFSIPELLVMFMGIIAPYYFLGVYLFLTDKFFNLSRFVPSFQFSLPEISFPLLFFIGLGLIVMSLLIGLYNWQNKNRRMLIQVRKNWGVLSLMVWVLTLLPFVNKDAGWESLLLWSIPVCPFIAYAFLEVKKAFWPNVLFWFFVLFAVVNNWDLVGLIKN